MIVMAERGVCEGGKSRRYVLEVGGEAKKTVLDERRACVGGKSKIPGLDERGVCEVGKPRMFVFDEREMCEGV